MVLLTGLRSFSHPFLDDSKALTKYDVSEDEVDLEVGIPSPGSHACVQDLDAPLCTVDAEPCTVKGSEIETLAIPPGRFTAELPDGCMLGEHISVRGPHGRRLLLKAPLNARPGEQLQLRLMPPAELRIQVPLGKWPGDLLRVRAADGREVEAVVPKGLQPGDFFEVAPPSLMVAVPEDAKAGDFVAFRRHEAGPDGKIESLLCRARIPHELLFGRYFAARTLAVSGPSKTTGRCEKKRGTAVTRASTWISALE